MLAYGLTIFTGAFLLFQVQPLIGKFLLPWFGGAPAVWTTCLLFFQVLLLGGYAYAHLSSRFLAIRKQILLHLALVVLAIAALPVTPDPSWKPQAASDPTFRIIALLSVTLGVPYFVLSATAPLLQHWFTRAHASKTPYRLYALSNAGSLLALLSYPVLFEPLLTRHAQAAFWAGGLGLYAVACAWSAIQLWRSVPADVPGERQGREGGFLGATVFASATEPSSADPVQPAPVQKLLWFLLPSCASVLLLAVTNKICQDVAVIPFLWVLPLSVYLLSFILCFDRPRWYNRLWFGAALLAALGAMTLTMSGQLPFSTPAQIFLYAAGLFVCSMVCHGEVYRLRPDPARLTSFYLMLAAGGAFGGVFVAVVAPRIFSDYFELHLGLLLCGLLFVSVLGREKQTRSARWFRPVFVSACFALAGLAALLWRDAHQYAAVRVYRSRNFYGVLNVYKHENQDPGRSLIELMHGRMAHGMQFLAPDRARVPTLYYSAGTGIGRTLASLPTPNRNVGVVGLGAGTLAAYATPGDRFRFYEINPEVEKVARYHFSFLRDSRGENTVVLGDARLSMEHEPAQDFDVLVLDAFNSDSIPLHLLTREAFQVYLRHVKPNGVIAAHISNASINLEPVLLNVAREFGLAATVIEYRDAENQWWVLPSTWVVLSKNRALLDAPAVRQPSRPAVLTRFEVPMWTDDFSALFPAFRWGGFGATRGKRAAECNRSAAQLSSRGDTAGAMAQYHQALKADPISIEALNNLACLLSIASDPASRNGQEAVELSERACALTDFHNTILVTTLAAAYAEAGRFDEAVSTAEKAGEMATEQNQAQLVKRNQELLEFYRRKEAYHQPPK